MSLPSCTLGAAVGSFRPALRLVMGGRYDLCGESRLRGGELGLWGRRRAPCPRTRRFERPSRCAASCAFVYARICGAHVGHMVVVFGFVPIAAPMLRAAMLPVHGRRANFWLFALVAFALATWSGLGVEESATAERLSMLPMVFAANFVRFLRDRRFVVPLITLLNTARRQGSSRSSRTLPSCCCAALVFRYLNAAYALPW